MATRLGKVVIYHEELPLIKLLDPQSRDFVRSRYIRNTLYLHLPIASKYGKVVTDREKLSPKLYITL